MISCVADRRTAAVAEGERYGRNLIRQSDSSESPATLSAGRLGLMIVEMELAYRFDADLPPRETPYSLDEVSKAVGMIHAAIECSDSDKL